MADSDIDSGCKTILGVRSPPDGIAMHTTVHRDPNGVSDVVYAHLRYATVRYYRTIPGNPTT